MTERRVEDPDLQWAAELAPRLLEEARAEALEEVRSQLRSRLVDALLSSAGVHSADQDTVAEISEEEAVAEVSEEDAVAEVSEEDAVAEVSEEHAPAEPSDAQQFGLWAYGVLDSDPAEPLEHRGVDPAHDVELIRHAGVAAVVSQVPLDEFGEPGLREMLEDADRLEALARAHHGVLDEALHRGTVVPFRICTIYDSADRVREMLARERDHLTAALRRLRGMEEWGVKAYAVGRADSDGQAAEPSSGIDYLSRKRADRDAAENARQEVDAVVESVHARLRELAADAVVGPPQTGPLSAHEGEMVLNAAYLVADEEASGFSGLVAALADRLAQDGLELELTGPWPAYHFSEALAQ